MPIPQIRMPIPQVRMPIPQVRMPIPQAVVHYSGKQQITGVLIITDYWEAWL